VVVELRADATPGGEDEFLEVIVHIGIVRYLLGLRQAEFE
jgi:hypothetical protein